MATTKRARYRFVVKEGVTVTHEPREGIIDMISPPSLVAEPCDRALVEDRPLQDSDLLSFHLREKVSLDQAGRIVDYLNERVQYVAITRSTAVEGAIDHSKFFPTIAEIRTWVPAPENRPNEGTRCDACRGLSGYVYVDPSDRHKGVKRCAHDVIGG